MKIELQRISLVNKDALNNLMQFYLYDYSDTDKRDINTWGRFEYEYLDSYFTDDESRMPFFIKLNDIIVGFVLVNNFSLINEDKNIKSIAEFFVMKKYRRIGIGSATLETLFKILPGKWEIKIDKNNEVGLSFWRKKINNITKGKYREDYLEDNRSKGYIESFEI